MNASSENDNAIFIYLKLFSTFYLYWYTYIIGKVVK